MVIVGGPFYFHRVWICMKNVGRCVTREKVIKLLNGMFQIKKKKKGAEWGSERRTIPWHDGISPPDHESSPLHATVAQVTLNLRFSQHCWWWIWVFRFKPLCLLVDSRGSFTEACCLHLQGGPRSYRRACVDVLNRTVEAGRFWNCTSNNIKMGLGVKDIWLEVGNWINFADYREN